MRLSISLKNKIKQKKTVDILNFESKAHPAINYITYLTWKSVQLNICIFRNINLFTKLFMHI